MHMCACHKAHVEGRGQHWASDFSFHFVRQGSTKLTQHAPSTLELSHLSSSSDNVDPWFLFHSCFPFFIEYSYIMMFRISLIQAKSDFQIVSA